MKIRYIKIVLFFGLFLVISCGSRKAEKHRIKEQTNFEIIDKSKNDKSEITEAKTDINIKKSTQMTVSNQDQTTTIKETIEPLDASKLASYSENGKKQELFNAKKTTETTTKNSNTKTELLEKFEELKKEDSKTNKKESEKKDIKAKAGTKKATEDIKVDREAWSVWNLLWMFVLVGVIYVIWRK